MRRLLITIPVCLAVSFALAACSDDDSGGPGPSGSGGQSGAATGKCKYLADSDAAALLGEQQLSVTGGDSGCVFRPRDDKGLGLQLSVTRIQIDPQQYADQSYAACDEKLGEVDVDGARKAWVCKDIEIQGYVVKDDLIISVAAPDLFSEPDPTDQQQTDIARNALPKIRFP